MSKTKGTMNSIGWAVKQMLNGKKVKRFGWHPGEFIVVMPGLNLPRIAKLNSQPYFAGYTSEKSWAPGFVFRTNDILATDWKLAND